MDGFPHNDGRIADDYPLEASPSTDTFAVAELNHATNAHVADAGGLDTDPERPLFEIMLRDTSLTLEVAL
jgi:hypothetical protein